MLVPKGCGLLHACPPLLLMRLRGGLTQLIHSDVRCRVLLHPSLDSNLHTERDGSTAPSRTV